MGRSYITTKPGIHESLGLKMYVQCTSPLRRYLDLIIQRQVYNKINKYEPLSKDSVSKIIDYSKNRQSENNNILKNDKYNLAAAFRIQKLNCNPSEILNRYKASEIKYII